MKRPFKLNARKCLATWFGCIWKSLKFNEADKSTNTLPSDSVYAAQERKPNAEPEINELLANPEATLVELVQRHRKDMTFSVKEWLFIVELLRSALISTRAHTVSLVSIRAIVQAALAVWELLPASRRTHSLEYYLLGNLCSSVGGDSFEERARLIIPSLSDHLSTNTVEFASRNLQVLLRDECYLLNNNSISDALKPYRSALLQIAIRGYWLWSRTPLPVAVNNSLPFGIIPLPPLMAQGVRFDVYETDIGMTAAITLEHNDVIVTLNSVPEIQELIDMLRQSNESRNFNGEWLSLYPDTQVPPRWVALRRVVQITLRLADYATLKSMVLEAMDAEHPIKGALDKMVWLYGSL